MFERYTEKARRVIFWARYEASQAGSPHIETEQLLLGILRECKGILNDFVEKAPAEEQVRNEIAAQTPVREKFPTSVDLPLSNASKRALAYGAEEAERADHRLIGCHHLLLGLLREEGSPAAILLRKYGLELEPARRTAEELAPQAESTTVPDREALHTLINSLPDSAFGAAANMLRRLQSGPLPGPGVIRGGRRNIGMAGARIGHPIAAEVASHFSTHMEDGTHVRESRVSLLGHAIAMTERIQIAENSKVLKYSQTLRGPKRDHQIDIDFDLT